MSDRDMWPNERDSTAEQWAAPPTGPEGQPGGPHGVPSYGGQSNPGTSYGAQGNPGTSYGPQGYDRPGYADPGYADPSYADQGQRGPDYGSAAGPQGPAYPYGPPHQAPYGQPPYGQPGYRPSPYGPPPYGGPPYGQPPYGPGPATPYGPYGEQPGPGPRPSGPPRRARGLRSAAAVLVIAAATLAGAGAGRVIWPGGQSASTATPAVTTPSGGAGSGTGSSGNPSSGNPFVYPFGGTGGTGSGVGSSSEGAGGPSDVSAIAAKVDPALVDVNVTFNYQLAEGAGTGIVLSSNGLVLTNNHVIDEATKISVTDVGNGKTYPATVVGYDNRHDVALLQLQGASGLTAAKLSASAASVGEAVVAIGNAGGAGGTPTSAGGSVTALDQSISASDELTQRSEQLSGLIEVNANVESGDSGGPLVNASGQVVGMDTAASESFAFSTQGNQGFAIPISYAMGLVKQIEAGKGGGSVHVGPTAFLGLLLGPPSASGQSPFGGTTPVGGSPFPGGTGSGSAATNGLEVSQVVAGAPAAKAGIAGGDTITSFNGRKVTTGEDLTQLLVGYHPGQKVTLGWVTSTGQSHTATVTLASGPPS